MALLNLQRVDASESVQRAFDEVENTLNTLPFPLSGAFINATVGTTETKVRHNLGTRPIGWIVVDQDADARVWRSGTIGSSFLPLMASAPVNLKLWVF